MTRGVLYMVWGKDIEAQLSRSISSLRTHHPDMPFEVVRLDPVTDRTKALLEKARMMALSPFEETLFLDADTVVLDTLDFGFLAAERTGLACCINENPWARRYRGLPNDDAIEYNTGVLFFNRTSTSLFRRWEELAKEVDSAIPFIRDNEVLIMPFADQGSFAKAVSEWDRLPFVLPINWNFRPEWHGGWFGPLKIWHAYASPPPQLTELLAYYKSKDAVIQFHELKRA